MDLSAIPDALAGLPPKFHLLVIYGYLVLKGGGELVSVVAKGGGLRNIIMRFWLGENVPKAVIDDMQKRGVSASPFQRPVDPTNPNTK